EFAALHVYGLGKVDIQAAQADFDAVFPGHRVLDLAPDFEHLMAGDLDAYLDLVVDRQGHQWRLPTPGWRAGVFRFAASVVGAHLDAEGDAGEVPKLYGQPFLAARNAHGYHD